MHHIYACYLQTGVAYEEEDTCASSMMMYPPPHMPHTSEEEDTFDESALCPVCRYMYPPPRHMTHVSSSSSYDTCFVPADDRGDQGAQAEGDPRHAPLPQGYVCMYVCMYIHVTS